MDRPDKFRNSMGDRRISAIRTVATDRVKKDFCLARQRRQPLDRLRFDATPVRVPNVAEKVRHCHPTVPAAWSTTTRVRTSLQRRIEIEFSSTRRASDTIERRCCWWACGAPNTVTDYNGNPTYFCTSDRCNGIGSENILPPPSNQSNVSDNIERIILLLLP